MIKPITTALVISATAPAAWAGCGASPEACDIEGGSYHIVLPEPGAEPAPVVVFLHGFGGNGAGVLKGGTAKTLAARGYAMIGPDGAYDEEFGRRRWNFFPGWEGRDEAAFLTAVVQDATDRFGTSPDAPILTGFSMGAFMVNYLACDAPESFFAYAPVAGGFWKPHPETCAGPVRLFHTHGWQDSTVPLEGRKLRGGAFVQGDIFAGLDIWRDANGCDDEKPSGFAEIGQFLIRKWDTCAPGSDLEMALFPGGHSIPRGWADMMLDWYEGLDGTH